MIAARPLDDAQAHGPVLIRRQAHGAFLIGSGIESLLSEVIFLLRLCQVDTEWMSCRLLLGDETDGAMFAHLSEITSF